MEAKGTVAAGAETLKGVQHSPGNRRLRNGQNSPHHALGLSQRVLPGRDLLTG